MLRTLILCLFPAISWASKKIVVIDPGHGGHDRGAVYTGTKESDIVLSISKKLKESFRNNPHVQVYLTREDDRPVGLNERIQMAESVSADLIVSVHANAATDPRARGVEFFIQNPLPSDEEALFLAHQESQIVKQKDHEDSSSLSKSKDVAAILEDLHRQNKFFKSLQLSEVLRQIWREQKPRSLVSIKQAPFYIVTQGRIPSVLVEVGFLSHPKEYLQLKDPRHHTEISQIIHKGILEYLRLDKKTPALTSNL